MEYDLTNVSAVRALLASHGFHFSKALGQNFLVDPTVSPRMAELCGADENIGVLEIGPGIGVLTAELAERAARVVAVELDARLMPVLAQTLAGIENVKLVNADVLKIDLLQLIEQEFAGLDVVCCANLPYYITSPVIMSLLERRLPLGSVTVMVQREAAMRLCAPPGRREAGAVSCAVSYYSEPHLLFDVPSVSFMPRPKVDSSVIRLDIRKCPPVRCGDERLMFRIIRAAFNQRRKTLLNALSAGLSLPKEQVGQALDEAGISRSERGERLTLEDFARLSDIPCIRGVPQ
ncbi:MAG: 16S rRNA (adenine(1518)-N(6)/adenine(1519)-N(6))-dimethyltransferase RsmA [Clostridia bacterium]|nr:16S rRNA (adenine(1518)-N(6)/adenine(1519)-N(6))-dimethyltransferase RsmA [Clostridia bacterium]MDR3643973.1 16S rRNA (adenine(1518)-N(6)/adenine(1519)-N(6))-dimethyltransferase RsmA [Clostridia bacterium]